MGQSVSGPATPEPTAPRNRTPDEIEALLDYEEPRLTCLRLAADERAKGATTTLSLARHGLKSLPPLPATLTSLDISYNRITAVPPELSQCTALQELRLRCNHLQASAKWETVITSLQQLVHLDMSWNFIDGANYVPHLTRLTYLSLLHNRSITRLPDLSPLAQLRYLSLAEVAPLQALPAGIWSLSALTELDLSSAQLEDKNLPDDAFAHLRNLRVLSLAYGSFPSLPTSIGSCDQLERLSLQSNLFSMLPDSIRNLTRLTYVNLSLNKLPAFPTIVSVLTTLVELHVNGNDYQSLPEEIGRLSALQKLALRFNAFTALPASLSLLTALNTLELGGCKIATWPACFSTLSRLAVLNLANNPTVAAEGVVALPALRRFRGPDALRSALVPTASGAAAAPQNNWTLPASPNTALSVAGSTLSPAELRNKIYGLVFGHALGDAIGLATEFLSTPQASYHCGLEISFDEMLRDRHRGRWIPGDWTDDTDQMLLILENLLEHKGTPDPVAFGRSLLQWAHRGMPEFGDAGGMGIGDTVSHVLMHPVFWENPQQAAREVWIKRNKNAAANGGVMRTAVLGVPSFGNIDTVLTNTDAVCQVTHADPRCRASCAAVAAAVALMLQGQTDVNAIIEAALAHAAKQVEDPTELRKFGISSLASMDLGERSSIGYTYKCFGSGFWALRQNNFADALSDITLEAGDADTNGAVAGALLGCRLGFAQLPQRWLDGLVHSAWLREKAEQLCQLVGV